MESKDTIRVLAALAVAAAGIVAAALAGAPLVAALLALLAGVAAYTLAPGAERTPPPPPPDGEDGEAAPFPSTADLLDAVDEPLLAVRERRVLLANRAAKALLGAHIEGVDVRLAIRHPAAAERLAGERSDAGRTELVGLGEPGRHWEIEVASLADGTRLVRLIDQSPARAAEQMRVDFVANASHELRTPLATLLGFLETLQDEEAGSDAKTRDRFLKIMSNEATRMRDLVEDLMSLSRIEADRFSTPRDPIDLLPLIESVKDGLKRLIESKESRIDVEHDARATLAPGDRPQLSQLLSNLLTNALKYGRMGTPVRVVLEDAGPDLVRIAVIDRGEGIAAEHIPRLTERFYRVDPGRSRSIGGTGLGLAIAKHVVLRHRGRLDIKSKVGEGTTVSVLLPRSSEAVTEPSSS